ncbi:hypothetical protein FRC06_002056, partial [Ceratobasidium sp. 370]
MPLGALARCMLPLLAAVPPDAENPFEHAPFTFPVYRANLGLPPMVTAEQLQLYEDESLDVDLKDPNASPVTAGDGFCFNKDAAVGLTPKQAAMFSNHSLDGQTDEGWGAYRLLTLVLLGRPGGIMDLAKEVMVCHRATPAEQWRAPCDENRHKVDGRPLDEYQVPIPSATPFTGSLPLLDEVAEVVFGPEVINDQGSVDSIYRQCCKVIANWVWEQMDGSLKTCIKKSKAMCATMDSLLSDARESGAAEDLVAALRHLKLWRKTAEKTLEAGNQPFLSREKELSDLFQSLGHEEELEEAGELDLLSRARPLMASEAGKKKNRGAKAGTWKA